VSKPLYKITDPAERERVREMGRKTRERFAQRHPGRRKEQAVYQAERRGYKAKPVQYDPNLESWTVRGKDLTITRTDIYEAYVVNKDTTYEIAERYGLSPAEVGHILKRFGIKARIGPKARRDGQRGENNPLWKGNNASYAAFHGRLKTARGLPRYCEVCGTDDLSKTYDWANLTGRYEDFDDYKRMCRSCHRKYDWQNPPRKGVRNSFGKGGDRCQPSA
jgi:hypothetical protein